MGIDKFTQVTNQSWFSRISEAFGGMIIGLLLFIGSFILLFWNEGRALKDARTIKEGKAIVVDIACEQMNPENNSKLVGLSGKVDTEEILIDQEFGIKEKALKLKRVVEMYQWYEKEESTTKKNIGGSETTTTTYTYKKDWSDDLIDSADFKQPDDHKNPKIMLYSSKTYEAKDIKLGDFFLSEGLKDQLNDFAELNINNDIAIPDDLKDKIKIHDGCFYLSNDLANPQIGDLRIKFFLVKPDQVTIVAQQINHELKPYLTKSLGRIQMLRYGTYSGQDMFRLEQEDAKILNWLLRLAGFVLMFIGLFLLLRPITVFSDIIPLLGAIVNAGIGIIAFLVSLILTSLTIALAWLAYRPFLAIGLIILAIGIIVLIKKKMTAKGVKV